jgi:GTP-binding protein EngB required for normal cell division
MSEEKEQLTPLSFDNDPEETLQPLVLDHQDNNNRGFVPIAQTTTNSIKEKDSNFVFFFGTAESGKSVILSSMLFYLSSQAGALRPKLSTPNTKEAEVLLYDFLENLRKGILPSRTTRDQVTRLDLVFEPNNRSKKVKPVNLTFLETSGENHNEIRRGGHYHNSIEEYLSANIPLSFILVTSYETAHNDDVLMFTFLNELERKGKSLKSVDAILVISKWDKSGSFGVSNAEQLENFIRERLPMTSQRLDTYGLNKTYYTIGNLEKNSTGEERLTSLNLQTAQVLSEWLYRSITGYDINYEGTFWERIKFSLFK